MLELLDLKGALVTIDAMGCQKEIAAAIVAKKADYVLTVKDNQPTLRASIQACFAKAFEQDFAGLLEAAGSSELNASTWNDRTNYFETLPANRLELALWLESERMAFLLDGLDQSKLDTQKDVVRNERRQSVEKTP